MVPLATMAPEMPKKPPPLPVPAEEQPSSETVRVASDLMEAMREICFGTRDTRGKRVKLTTLVDGYLRPLVLRDLRELRRRQASEKPEGDKE